MQLAGFTRFSTCDGVESGWFCCGTWVVSDIFLPVFVPSIGWFGKDYRVVIILFLAKGRKE